MPYEMSAHTGIVTRSKCHHIEARTIPPSYAVWLSPNSDAPPIELGSEETCHLFFQDLKVISPRKLPKGS